MSEEKRLLTGTPIVSFDDANEFFSQRVTGSCPCCGHNHWAIFTSTLREGGGSAVALAAVNVSNFASMSAGMPVVIATCKKCAFIRPHSMLAISQWIDEGKLGFKDDE